MQNAPKQVVGLKSGEGGHKSCVLGERQLTIRAYVVERA